MTERTVYLSGRIQESRGDVFDGKHTILQLSTPYDDFIFPDVVQDVYQDLCTDPINVISAINFKDFASSLFIIYAQENHALNKLAFMCLVLIAEYRADLFSDFKLSLLHEDLICGLVENIADDSLRAGILIEIPVNDMQDELARLRVVYLTVSNPNIGDWYANQAYTVVQLLSRDTQLLQLQLLIMECLVHLDLPPPELHEFDQSQLLWVIDSTPFALEALNIVNALHHLQILDIAHQVNIRYFLDPSCAWRLSEAAITFLLLQDRIDEVDLALCAQFLISSRQALRSISAKLQQKFGFDMAIVQKYIDQMDAFNDSEFVVKTVLRGLAYMIASDQNGAQRLCKMLGVAAKLQDQIGEFGCSVDSIIYQICEALS